jgi:hypothetical protein
MSRKITRRPRPWTREPGRGAARCLLDTAGGLPLPALLCTTLASVAGMLLVMLGPPAISLFGQPPAGSVMSACQGRLRPLLVILQRGNQAPNEIARPGRNPTEVSGVDAPIDVGG